MKNEHYLGNRNLKKDNVTIQFTRFEIEEYVKCSKDVDYFCANYVKIVNVDKGLIQFVPYEYQGRMFKTFDENRYTICKMPRQVGKTTGVVGYLLHKMLFNENFNIAVLANKESQSIEILQRVQLAYEWLPKWLQQGVVEWGKKSVELENGSKCMASATSSSAIRGRSFNLIYLDEFAFVPRNIQDQFFASVFPTISSGKTTKLIMTSTPNGMDMFHKIWVESEQEKNTYARVDVHWSDVPGRDRAWADEMIRNTSMDQFRQEFECEFLGSSHTLIHPTILSRLVWYEPNSIEHNVKIFKQPEKNHVYAMTVDVSEGVGLDASSFTIIDCSVVPYEVVATFNDSNIPEILLPTLLHNVGRYYNDASILIETNIGSQVVNILHQDLEYENIVMTKQNARRGVNMSAFAGNQRMGIKQSKVTKKIGCGNLKAMIESDKLRLNDYEIIKQLYTYVLDKNTYNAEEGHKDDLVMCLVMFAWMVSQNYFKDVSNSDVRKKLLEENERYNEEELTPFGFYDDGHADPVRTVVSESEFKDFLLN